MISYRNIGVLDMRNATKEGIADIHELFNVGTIIVKDTLMASLSNIKQRNIGTLIVIPETLALDLVMHDGDFEIDSAFVDGLMGKNVLIMVNGNLKVSEEVGVEAFESFYRIIVNGRVEVPKFLKAAFALRSEVNGQVVYYDPGDILMDTPFMLDKDSLWSFSPKSVIRSEQLIALDPMPIEDIQKTFNQFKVGSLVTTQEMMQQLAPMVLDFHKVEKQIIPKGARYFQKLEITDANVSTLNTDYLYVEGKLVIKALSPESLHALDKLKGIICGKCHVAEAHLNWLESRLIKAGSVQVISDNMRENYSKLILDQAYMLESQNVTISNYGKLVFTEDVTPDALKEAIKRIDNYGKISCSEGLYAAVMGKIKQNYGVVKPDISAQNQSEQNQSSEVEDGEGWLHNHAVVANMGRVTF